jgi:hypothetical protein
VVTSLKSKNLPSIMLHLFYVYSGIVARVVPLIIERLQLDAADVLIVNDRSQTSASSPSGLSAEDAGFRKLSNRWRTLPSDWIAIRYNSCRIEKLTRGQKFIAYLPSPSDRVCQQILWHPLCQKYLLIEEGLGSYCSPGVSPVHPEPFTFFQRLSLGARIRSLGRITPAFTDFPHWQKKYAGSFGSKALTFPGFPAPVINLDHPIYQAVSTSITRLVILDDFSVFNTALQTIYLDVIGQVISAEHSNGDHWAYKVHPRCASWGNLHDQVRKVFEESLPPGTSFESLLPDTCAEDIGISEGVTTYGYMSSCLFYIHQAGGKVVSFKKIVEAGDPAFGEFWKLFFPPQLEQLVSEYKMLEHS